MVSCTRSVPLGSMVMSLSKLEISSAPNVAADAGVGPDATVPTSTNVAATAATNAASARPVRATSGADRLRSLPAARRPTHAVVVHELHVLVATGVEPLVEPLTRDELGVGRV